MDTLEIIRQLQKDAALRAQLRAVLLSDEILTLPELVQENSRQIAALVERMDRVEAQIAALVERMDRVEAQIASLVQTVASMNLRISDLEKDMQSVKRDLGDVKGSQLEDDLRAHPRAYVRKSHMIAVKALSFDEKYEICEQLGGSEGDDLALVDVLIRGERLDGSEAYIAVEASATLENDDLSTVIRRAQILSKATKLPVLPLAVCKTAPSKQLLRRAQKLGVAVSRRDYGIVAEAPYIQSVA